jgi:hypothetical protein
MEEFWLNDFVDILRHELISRSVVMRVDRRVVPLKYLEEFEGVWWERQPRLTRSHWVSQGLTESHKVSLSLTRSHWVSLSLTKSHYSDLIKNACSKRFILPFSQRITSTVTSISISWMIPVSVLVRINLVLCLSWNPTVWVVLSPSIHYPFYTWDIYCALSLC